MIYVAFVFAIFGFMAYLQISSLKKRVDELERTLSKQEGTSYYNRRKSLSQIARSYIGKPVTLTMRTGSLGASTSSSLPSQNLLRQMPVMRHMSPSGSLDSTSTAQSYARM